MSPTDDGLSNKTCIPLVLRNGRQFPKGPAMVFKLLKQHQQFLDNFASFQIKGVHCVTMDILKIKILTDCPAITAIEKSFMSDDFGKWYMCSTIENIKNAKTWIDEHLQFILDELPPDDKLSLPTAIVSQRIVYYGDISDSQVDHLMALSGISATEPVPNAWNTPHL